jgi:hypothetical protein
VHRALGYTTREGWVRERLGMDPTRARALVRLERACATSPALARAWRRLALSWPRAEALVPLVSADALGRFTDDWVRWARRVTVRRLRDDAERAVVLAETDPAAFRREGGLPPEARQCRLPAGHLQDGRPTRREIGAGVRDAEEEHTRPGPDAAEAPIAHAPGIGADLRDDEGEHPRPGPDAAEPPIAPEREIGADRRGAEGEPTWPGPDTAEGPMAPEREIGAARRDPEREAPPHYPAPGARAHAGLGGRPDPTRRAGSA